MDGKEKHKNAGIIERLARFQVIEGLGVCAVAATCAVLLPPAGAAIATMVVVGEAVGVGAAKLTADHLKQRRTR